MSTMTDQARLITAGWKHTPSNRWLHPAFPGTNSRVRLFTLPDALALLDADPSTPRTATHSTHQE